MRMLCARRGGYFFRADLIEAGGSDADLRAAKRSGLVVRLRHGTFALGEVVRRSTPEQKHLLVARSVLERLGPGVALSHHSAALAHAPHSFDVDLDAIHVTRLDGTHGRREAGVFYHVGALTEADLVEVEGLRVTSPARAAFEAATISTTGVRTGHDERCGAPDGLLRGVDGDRPAARTLARRPARSLGVAPRRSRLRVGWRIEVDVHVLEGRRAAP